MAVPNSRYSKLDTVQDVVQWACFACQLKWMTATLAMGSEWKESIGRESLPFWNLKSGARRSCARTELGWTRKHLIECCLVKCFRMFRMLLISEVKWGRQPNWWAVSNNKATLFASFDGKLNWEESWNSKTSTKKLFPQRFQLLKTITCETLVETPSLLNQMWIATEALGGTVTHSWSDYLKYEGALCALSRIRWFFNGDLFMRDWWFEFEVNFNNHNYISSLRHWQQPVM